jgi:hypothetical protein
MADQDWLNYLPAVLGGGVGWKLLEFLYKEYKSHKEKRSDRARVVDISLEPLLRSADELVGKLHSLAKQDFMPVRGR